jgi:hypothetical protein
LKGNYALALVPILAAAVPFAAIAQSGGPMKFEVEADTPANTFERMTFRGGRYSIYGTGDITEDRALIPFGQVG